MKHLKLVKLVFSSKQHDTQAGVAELMLEDNRVLFDYISIGYQCIPYCDLFGNQYQADALYQKVDNVIFEFLLNLNVNN